jgi:hypothetical protein
MPPASGARRRLAVKRVSHSTVRKLTVVCALGLLGLALYNYTQCVIRALDH